MYTDAVNKDSPDPPDTITPAPLTLSAPHHHALIIIIGDYLLLCVFCNKKLALGVLLQNNSTIYTGKVTVINYDLPENQYLVQDGQIMTTPQMVRKSGTSVQTYPPSSPDILSMPATTTAGDVSPSLSAIFNTSLDSDNFIQCLDQVEATKMNL
ncbi:hypothetical protein FRB99_003973 [Tulasnella sp. 403]|nr:hypothetical protein FRB99_003973 [Tulasnella sp. 403]